MRAVGVMEVAIHQVIGVIPMRYSLVAAVRAVCMRLIMSGTGMARRTFLRINRAHCYLVVFHVISGKVMQVAIM